MREIKFRAWDKKNMIYSEKNKLLPRNIVDKNSVEKGKVLMQFTNLKDKNGKEIYEGDILDGDYVVFFYEGCFITRYKKTDSIWGFDELDDGGDFIKVIGNIYENPELLNQDVKQKDSEVKDGN